MWENLIKKLESLMKNLNCFQNVYIYEAEKFSGSPVCTITPSDNEASYETNAENERIYAFSIRIYVNRSVAPSGRKVEDYADERLRDLVTKVIDKLDQNYMLSGLTVPSGYYFVNMFAAPSTWGYAGREDEYRAAEVNVRCRVLVDLNNL